MNARLAVERILKDVDQETGEGEKEKLKDSLSQVFLPFLPEGKSEEELNRIIDRVIGVKLSILHHIRGYKEFSKELKILESGKPVRTISEGISPLYYQNILERECDKAIDAKESAEEHYWRAISDLERFFKES